jgi:rhamnosyltransferase subunit B
MAARIVITSWGSYGDVYPYLGLALALRARGHAPVLATAAHYRGLIERESIVFHPIRPDIDPSNTEIIKRVMDPAGGTRFLIQDLLMASFADAYADLDRAARGADLLVTHPVTFAGPLVAEKQRLRWAASALAPMSFFSLTDLPIFPRWPWLSHLGRLGPWASRRIMAQARRETRAWTAPVAALRADLGLRRAGDPLYEGQFSPYLNLALFSRVLADPQPDWPPNTHVTGFVPYNGPDRLPAALGEFLDRGDPPIVFTLGSSAVGAAGAFYEESAKAASQLGLRAVLLIGGNPMNRPREPLPPELLAIEHAPHQELFPHAAAIVHQCGIGTTGQALRSGRPQLLVPHAHDQPDNAFRVRRLGVARQLSPQQYRAARVTADLRSLLSDPTYAARANEVALAVNAEAGVEGACQAIEELVGRTPAPARTESARLR